MHRSVVRFINRLFTMKTFVRPLRLVVLALAALLAAPFVGIPQEQEIDWDKARALHQKAQRGEKLAPEEQAYYDRAKKLRARGEQRPDGKAPSAPPVDAAKLNLTPLTELADAKYKGEDGGLYGGGRNEPPPAHLEAARKAAAAIQPLDAEGRPSADGRVVLLSLGMSNTTQEFSRFKQLADADPRKSPGLVIVDGAQGGQDARRTSDPSAPFWANVDQRLKAAGVTPRQVQVVWLKQAMIQPREDFPAEAKRLQELLVKIVHIAKERHPNLRLMYLSSRTYAGYATTPLNPEPHAYESAFSVRWLIQDQMKGGAALNHDPAKGGVKAPVLLWGPYLWANGGQPRKADGFLYKREDFAGDGTHPSQTGRQKVAGLLLAFFTTDPVAKVWFVKKGE